jgi:hypothetical protein
MTGERQLFNGTDLTGWRHVGPGAFEVEDGCLKTVGGMGLLYCTEDTFGDCLIRVIYRTSRESDNSGVFIRIGEEPPDPWYAVHHGYEVQILATADDWHRSGVIYSMTRAEVQADAPPGEWNTLEITLEGDSVLVHLNQRLVTHFDPSQPVPERTRDYEPERGPRATRGYIGLQNHDANSSVYFREVSVHPLERKGRESA